MRKAAKVAWRMIAVAANNEPTFYRGSAFPVEAAVATMGIDDGDRQEKVAGKAASGGERLRECDKQGRPHGI
ncbi:hypothetical protein IEQ34_019547 [Dendrobium chrysotoxum]|uniref:Uncharacterized protein n=1 Tax=Dendrobium chrysotoxum TaxID=161865 RepID=A0AAV7G9B4_DENCH|nr:hypothetical protein IEQ34_019547 [Dendrobium chrysotoxum]